MNSSLRLLTLAAALVAGSAAASTITGQVTYGGVGLPSVAIMGPKANCTLSDGAGNYTCTVPANWTGTLAAHGDGYGLSPASRGYAALNANQAGQNFSAARAAGLASDLAIWRPLNARFHIDTNGDKVPDIKPYFGGSTDIGLAGDLDGNGVTDLVLYRNGLWFVDFNLDGGAADQMLAFGGAPGDVPLLGDLNGDGIDDLVVYRNGTWFVSTQRTGFADQIYHFGGIPGVDVPLLGDFDGDGVADLVIYRNGIWFIDTNRDGIADIVVYHGGLAGDIPVVLDYNGDGRSDIAIYRNGTWFVNTRLDGTVQAIFSYGGAVGDRPLAGRFDRGNTLFVKAGSPCMSNCTMANPYRTITAAWQDAPAGSTIRVAAGTYPENLLFSYPGIQYAPGKFGKNDIKLLGVSRSTVVVAPPAGDALFLQAATGYVVRNMRFTGAPGLGRGIVTAGGPGSVLAAHPGPQLSLVQVDAIESDGTNVLLTGTSNVRIRDSRISRSRAGHGASVWGYSYARVLDSDVEQNGYAIAPGPPPPDAGKGLDVRDDSEIDARRNLIRANLTFGVIAINRSVLRLTSNAITASGYDGIIVCGAAANDTTASYLTGNWIAGNGTVQPVPGWNGLEYYLTCIGSHQVTGNSFVANTQNGIFIGSGTLTLTGNAFQANRVGVVAFAGTDAGTPSSTDTTLTVYGNVFDTNTVGGFYGARSLGTTRALTATIGGTGAGQANVFKNHPPPAYFGISCDNLATTFACPTNGNTFSNNATDIAATCPASCVK